MTGTIKGFPIANGNITVDGVLTGESYAEDGREFDFQFTLSRDKRTLAGTIVVHYDGDESIPCTFTKMSTSASNSDPTPPAVNHVTLDRYNNIVTITWSKPVFGWDLLLRIMIGETPIDFYGNQLVDPSKNTYDPETNTFTMQIWPSVALDSNGFTLILDQGSVDWSDPYGVPAWSDSRCVNG